MKENSIKEILFKMADDALIIGHRNSEWTGLGPIIEEDIAFSSIAQDKIGHSLALFTILYEEFQEKHPDQLAFMREAKDFKCSHFVELPIGEYDFSLVRHFLFDIAEEIRYEMLSDSSFLPLANLAKKIKGEIKYHTLHAETWMIQLGNGNAESNNRLQKSIDFAMPYALGMFEQSTFEKELIEKGIFQGEQSLKKRWLEKIKGILNKSNLKLGNIEKMIPLEGGRIGNHTEFLPPLLIEMGEVFRIDAKATW